MRAPLVAAVNQRGSRTGRQVYYTLFNIERNILIYAPHTRTLAFWRISNIPPKVS